jgi:hypothetical protein
MEFWKTRLKIWFTHGRVVNALIQVFCADLTIKRHPAWWQNILSETTGNNPLLEQLFYDTSRDNRRVRLRKSFVKFSLEEERSQTVTAHNIFQKVMT